MTEEMERVSLTVPADLLGALDGVVAEWGYDSRSEAARDALGEFVSDYRERAALTGRVRGAVVVLYDHDVTGVSDELTALQHERHDAIVATQHVHLSHELCLETLVVDGPGEAVGALVNRLGALDGVRRVTLAGLD